MCLAVPGRLTAIDGKTGVLDFQGNELRVSLAMTPEAKVGAWLLVHAGMALQEVDPAEARKTWEYLQEMGVAEMPADLA
jgi:hydrogenase expression/formation protein HypC